jgi:hypothetical protein
MCIHCLINLSPSSSFTLLKATIFYLKQLFCVCHEAQNRTETDISYLWKKRTIPFITCRKKVYILWNALVFFCHPYFKYPTLCLVFLRIPALSAQAHSVLQTFSARSYEKTKYKIFCHKIPYKMQLISK